MLLRCHFSVHTSAQITAHCRSALSSLGSLHSAIALSVNRHCWKFSFCSHSCPTQSQHHIWGWEGLCHRGREQRGEKPFVLEEKGNAQGDNVTEREGVKKNKTKRRPSTRTAQEHSTLGRGRAGRAFSQHLAVCLHPGLGDLKTSLCSPRPAQHSDQMLTRE